MMKPFYKPYYSCSNFALVSLIDVFCNIIFQALHNAVFQAIERTPSDVAFKAFWKED
jgi:hypothetical protein